MGTLLHILDLNDPVIVGLGFFILVYLVALIIIHGKMSKNEKHKKIWNALCFVPLLLSAIHIMTFVGGDAFIHIFTQFQRVYISAVLIAFLPLLTKKKALGIIGYIVCVVSCMVHSFFCLDTGKPADFSGKSKSDAYISLCDFLEENYVLSEWKNADFEKLKADGLALIDEAEKTGDTDKYYDALYMLMDTFHDSHFSVYFYDSEPHYLIDKVEKLSDYGLSLLTLDNGDTIAVNVDEGLEIKAGDVITKWNGVPVDEAAEDVDLVLNMGTTPEHNKLQKTFFLSATGGDTVDVTYINSDGKETVTTLNKIEGNSQRAGKSLGIFTQSYNDKYDCRMLNDNIGYLKVVEEVISYPTDLISSFTGEHSQAREMFREDLRELRAQGMTKLVIDIRYNSGGYDEISMALVSLFTNEEMYAYSLGVKNGREIKNVCDKYVKPDGEFSDIEIVVLTGMSCGSAGDDLAVLLSKLPNATVAGLTDPAGSAQESGGVVYMPGNAAVDFPVGLILDENGNPNIDTDHTGKSRNPVDIRIPLDKEAALKIFSGEDYELEWAMDYLNKTE